tara:strand:+ start:9162 stop:10157 length:996 start_codon:yes stop_codon:yes gene_type:complete
MPFQSEKQRRYLWANEPEIARDWADTYGSRVENNMGGITRASFAMGSPWTWLANMVSGGLKDYVTETPSQQAWDYLGQQEYKTPDGQSIMDYGQSLYQPGQILEGYNPVSSFGLGPMGTLQKRRQYMLDRMAAGKTYSEKNLDEVTNALNILQGSGDNMGMPQADPGDWSTYESNPTGEFNDGGRVGFFEGALADTAEGQAMSPGTTAGGEFRSGPENMNQGNAGYQDPIMLGGTGIKPEPKKNLVGMGIAGLRGILPFLGEKGTLPGVALSIYDIINQEADIDDMVLSADEEKDDTYSDEEKRAMNIRNMEKFITNQKLKNQADIFKEYE